MDKSATLLLNGKVFPVLAIRGHGAVIYLDEDGRERFAIASTFVGSVLIADKLGTRARN